MTTTATGIFGTTPEVKITLAQPEDHSSSCALYKNESCDCGGKAVHNPVPDGEGEGK